ncbi:MAG: hypothetical protein DRG36_02485 [Deltaproteobacteria bacterium]|nr:MAG: hypothetical protein DRG36_02485 [Deltaproteobacteria bacterium]
MKGRRGIIGLGLTIVFAILLFHTGAAFSMPAGKAWGKPPFPPGSPVNYQIWHDEDGWHIRWTSAVRWRHFRGRVWSPDGEIFLVRKVAKEQDDIIRKRGNAIVFNAHTCGGWDGFDFRFSGREVVFDLKIDGRYRPERVFIGASALNPHHIPFAIRRHPRGHHHKRPKTRTCVAYYYCYYPYCCYYYFPYRWGMSFYFDF